MKVHSLAAPRAHSLMLIIVLPIFNTGGIATPGFICFPSFSPTEKNKRNPITLKISTSTTPYEAAASVLNCYTVTCCIGTPFFENRFFRCAKTRNNSSRKFSEISEILYRPPKK